MVLSFFKRKKKEEPKAKAQPSQPNQSNNYKEIIEESPITGLKYHYNYDEKDKSIDLLSPGILDAWVENPGQIKEDYLKELFEEATYMIPNPHKEMTSLKKINISLEVPPRDVDFTERNKITRRFLEEYYTLYLLNLGGANSSFGVYGLEDPEDVDKLGLLNKEFPFEFSYLVGAFSGFLISDNFLIHSDLKKTYNDEKLSILMEYKERKPVSLILDNSEYTAYQAGHFLKAGIRDLNNLPEGPERFWLPLYYSFKAIDIFLFESYAMKTVWTGAIFGLTNEEIRNAIEEDLTKGIPPEVEEERRRNNSPTRPHKVEINEERLIHATYNLGASEDNDYPELLSEFHKNLNQKGYELYQDVIVIIKKGALRPIYYSLVYPVKKETAEEIGSKVTLYRVKTDEDTGKVISLEPIEEHKVKGTIDDLIEQRNKEIIDIYNELVNKYGKDPIRDEKFQIYVYGDLYNLCTKEAYKTLKKAEQKLLNKEYLREFFRKYKDLVIDSNLKMLEIENGEDYVIDVLYLVEEACIKNAWKFVERSKNQGQPTIGGPLLFYYKKSRDVGINYY